jgi:hypothetical protein
MAKPKLRTAKQVRRGWAMEYRARQRAAGIKVTKTQALMRFGLKRAA